MFACALIGLPGCCWVQRNQGKNEEICRTMIEQSFSAQQSGELDEARKLLNDALELEPKHAETWWNLAELSIHQDNFPQAIEEQKKYVELQPHDPHGYLRLAQLYYLQGDYDEAQETLKETTRRIPNNIEAIILSARLARKQADHQQAMADYYHVLQVQPNHPEATLELAEMMLARSEPTRAATILRSLARSNLSTEDEARTQLNLGIAYGQAGRWDDAVEHLELAESLNETSTPRDRYRLAYAYYKAGTSQQSLEILLNLADSHQWDDRAERLYATITGTIPQTAYVDPVVSVSHEKGAQGSVRSFIDDVELNPVFAADRLLQAIEQTEVDIVPPEWSSTPGDF